MGEHRYRAVFIGVWGVTLVGAVGGATSMLIGQGTPPLSAIEPLGLDSWVLPGLWLLASVALPSAVVVVLAWRRSPRTPAAVLVASGLLAIELAVQVPFVGPSVLQAVFGAVAVTMAALAWAGRDTWEGERRA